jgi:hypothetical protein
MVMARLSVPFQNPVGAAAAGDADPATSTATPNATAKAT